MKNFKIILCTLCAAASAAFAQTATNALPPAPENATALSVQRLPDLKLNDDVIRKSVLTYNNMPELSAAKDAILKGDAEEAKKIYAQAADNSEISSEVSAEAAAELAIMYLESGSYDKALDYISTAVEQDDQNPFYKLEQIWIYSASGKLKKAREAYNELLFLTADFEYLSSAKVALAAAEFYDGDYKSAATRFEDLYGADPYVISYAVYMLGRINYEKGSYNIAKPLFDQALRHDINNYSAEKYLAETQKELKQYVPAWQSYANLLVLDNKDEYLAENVKKLSQYLNGDPKDYLFYARLKEIYNQKPSSIDSPLLRIALFTDAQGNQSEIQKFYFLPGSSFTVWDAKRGQIMNVPAFTPRTVVFDPVQKAVIIQNKWNNAEFATKQPFEIRLDQKGASLLIKDAQSANVFAANTGDKELKGIIKVTPGKNGMTLTDYTTLEDALPALLTSEAKENKNPEFLRAAAIVLRTQILKNLEQSKDKSFDMADNNPNLTFGGINMQSDFAANAAAATVGQKLAAQDGSLPSAGIYASCSALSEDGVRNTQSALNYSFSPANLFKFTISNPPADLISAPQDPTLWSSVKWIYAVPAKEVKQRLEEKYKIGRIKQIYPSAFSAQGRALKISFVGTKKTLELPFEEANFMLAAGTLRSNLLVIIPFGRQNKPEEFLIAGSDTGFGSGLCADGAYGMALQGKSAEEILKYYFPSLQVSK